MCETPINVLLVEDSFTQAKLLLEVLEAEISELFNVVHVVSLYDALHSLKEGEFDAILLDLTLPDSRGMESLEPLVEQAPEVPIVVLTSTNDDRLALKMVRKGAQDYLVKHQVSKELLIHSLRYAIERKKFADLPTDRFSYQYQIGGSLAPDAPSYIVRQADSDFYEALQAGKLCYVFNSRQMGKSSLRVHTMQALLREGIACAYIDMSSIITKDLTPDSFYATFIEILANEFDIPFKLSPWWQERELLSPLRRMSEFIEEILLREVTENIVIFIDEIDSTLNLKFPTDYFFAFIRGCYEQRVDHRAYQRLTFALLGVATPSILIQDKRRTPFNLGHAIELNGFQEQEALPLAEGLVKLASNPQAVLKQILSWTGGQPFLTQKLCQLVIDYNYKSEDSNLSIPLGEEAILVENIVRKYIINNWESQDEPEHLRTIRDRLIKRDNSTGKLLRIYQQILQDNNPRSDYSQEQIELILSGLVVKNPDFLQVKNQIYQEVFNREWVEKQLASLRPYSQALDAWQASGRRDESRLLRGQALKDALIWAEGKNLGQLDFQFLVRSEELDNQEEQRVLEAARTQEIEARLAQEQKTARLQKRFLIAITTAFAIAVGLGVTTYLQYRQALKKEIQSIATSSEALWTSNQRLDALIQGIKAKRRLEKLVEAEPDIQKQVDKVLQQAVYGVQEYNRLSSHEDRVYGVAISPDGKMIASASKDKTVKLWKRDGTLLRTFRGHQDWVRAVAISKDGKIASASWDKTVNLWNSDGQLIKTLTGHSDRVNAVSISPDGKMIASAAHDQTVKLWTIDGNLIKTLNGHNAPIYGVSISPDGKMVASASEDQTVKLWRIDGTLLNTLRGHREGVRAVAISPDGKMIVSGSRDSTIKVWTSDGQLIRTLRGHTAPVYGVSISPDGKMIASASLDKTVKLWHIEGTELTTLKGHRNRVWQVSFSPDGKMLVSASWDNTVKLWKRESSLLGSFKGHDDVVIKVDSGCELIASASDDDMVKIWRKDGTEMSSFDKYSAEDYGIAISPDCKEVASGSVDKTIKLWHLDGRELATFTGHQGGVWGVSFSPDGNRLASASEDKTVKLWTRDGQELATFTGHRGAVWDVSFSPDGNRLASASEDKTVKLWTRDGQDLATLRGHKGAVWGVSFSRDGNLLASASEDKTVKLWTRDGQDLATLRGHTQEVKAVAISPDGKLIASASEDKMIKLWNRDGKELKTLRIHDAPVWGLAFSDDGETLASAGEDQRIILWNLPEILQLNELNYACDWVRDYLHTNVEVQPGDRTLCD